MALFCQFCDLLLFGVLLNQVGQFGEQRSGYVLQNALLKFDSESLVFLVVKFDEKLGCVERGTVRIPLDEVLETLRVFEDGAQTAQRDSLQRILTPFKQIKQNLDSLNVEQVEFRPFVSKNGVLEAGERSEQVGGGIARLVDLQLHQVVFKRFNSVASAEHLLVFTTLLRHVRKDVECQFADVQGARLRLTLNNLNQSLNQVALLKRQFENVEE